MSEKENRSTLPYNFQATLFYIWIMLKWNNFQHLYLNVWDVAERAGLHCAKFNCFPFFTSSFWYWRILCFTVSLLPQNNWCCQLTENSAAQLRSGQKCDRSDKVQKLISQRVFPRRFQLSHIFTLDLLHCLYLFYFRRSVLIKIIGGKVFILIEPIFRLNWFFFL